MNEQALKERIKIISKELNISFNECFKKLLLERFLVRLSKSSYINKFIFKGGFLLSYLINIGRETKDLDFAIQGISNNLKEIEKVIKEIIFLPINDGFVFENLKVREMPHPLMHYFGARISMNALFDKIRFKVIVDLGFGDFINPDEYDLPLTGNKKSSLFESTIKFNCYPIDFIFAEKLHSIIVRGQDNSRMKDFHDLYLLINQKGNEFHEKFMLILEKVFEHRNSAFVLPLKFNEKDLFELQNHWKRHLKGLKNNHIFPYEIKDVIFAINEWLEKVAISAN